MSDMAPHHLSSARCPNCGELTIWSDGGEEWCKNCTWQGDIVEEGDSP